MSRSVQATKVEIPRELQHAIMKIQVEEDLEFDEAAKKVALLADKNSLAFKKKVNLEADRKAKSEYMTALNKAKESIRASAWDEGHDNGLEEGWDDGVLHGKEEFQYPCRGCGKPITLSDKSWKDARNFLIQNRWGHANC